MPCYKGGGRPKWLKDHGVCRLALSWDGIPALTPTYCVTMAKPFKCSKLQFRHLSIEIIVFTHIIIRINCYIYNNVYNVSNTVPNMLKVLYKNDLLSCIYLCDDDFKISLSSLKSPLSFSLVFPKAYWACPHTFPVARNQSLLLLGVSGGKLSRKPQTIATIVFYRLTKSKEIKNPPM